MNRILAIAVLLLCVHIGFAQEQEAPKKDNTGTNPTNFTYDARFYTEMSDLHSPDGSGWLTTFEFRLPFGRDLANVLGKDESKLIDLGQMFGLRTRIKYNSLNIDKPDTSTLFNNEHISGIADMDFRLLAVAYSNKRFILAPGIEATLNTATNDALGSGKYILTPMIFGGFPGALGPGSLFVPGYQLLIGFGGDDDRTNVLNSVIDVYLVWLLAEKKHWLIIDPQIVINHRTSKAYSVIDFEWGTMIKPIPGGSVWIRPAAGVGGDRPLNWAIETGFKFVWR